MPWDWSRSHASQAELQSYIEAVIDGFGVSGCFRYGVSVTSARWDQGARGYRLETSQGPVGPFDLLVSSVGMLSNPSIPDWAHDGVFRGPVFHSAAYRHDVDLRGKRVALVGTGSTACQLAPKLAAVAGRLDIYQREPGYVMPKRARDFTEEERALHRQFPVLWKLSRWKLLYQGNQGARAFRISHPDQRRLREFHRSYLERKVADPVVRRALTPDYPYGCKRPVFSSEFYPVFNLPNVTLVPEAVSALTERGVVDHRGTERVTDVVVLATGFRAAEYLSTLSVTGREGRTLHEAWDGEPWGFLGMTVPGFPNFFMLYGPNTNGGWSICGQLERQSRLVARVAKRMAARRVGTVDTRRAVATSYDRWVQRSIRSRRDANESGCHNYFHSPSGKNVTQWPYSAYTYDLVVRGLSHIGLSYRGRHPRGGRVKYVPVNPSKCE
jgi:cation diffusion facilitator CzcD-associated flavoprotein CzcO